MTPSRPTRIGMIVPSSNTCLEPQTSRLLAGRDDVTVHHTRIAVTTISLADDSARQFGAEEMRRAAELLATADVDVIAWNGTSGSWLGLAEDEATTRLITQSTGVPATTSTLALFEAFRALGVSRLGLLTPYTADVNEQIATRYAEQGVEVVDEVHLGLSVNESFAAVGPQAIADGTRSLAAARPDAVGYVCTNLYGAPVVADLEADLGVDILDSVVVTLWHCLRLAGAAGLSPQWGRALAGSDRAATGAGDRG